MNIISWILKNWASLASIVVSLTSLTIAIRTQRRANRLVRSQRRNELLTQVFALNSKLYEAGLLLDESDFAVFRVDSVLEKRGRQLPKEARVEYEAGALNYRKEFKEIQTELLVKVDPLEEASKSYSLEELDDCIIIIQALHATVDEMIKRYGSFKKMLQELLELHASLHG